MDLTAEFECVLAARIRDVVYELESSIRALELGPLETTEGKKLAEPADPWQSASQGGAGDSSVQAVS